jgi:thiol-disulfide isomerase/thioredoxin
MPAFTTLLYNAERSRSIDRNLHLTNILFMKYIFVLICLLATTILYAQPKVGQTSPEIAMKDINGKVHKLSDLKGKVVLIDFWASWCGPCRKTMPGLVSLYQQYKSKGFEIYGISIDDNKAAWKKAVADDKITWLQVNEPGGWNGATATAWNLEQIPASFLLDKNGKVIAVDPSREQIESYLKKLLK